MIKVVYIPITMATADFVHTGVKVVVMDAAVLLQAEWDRDLNEVWGCIIPADEVCGINDYHQD